MKTLHKNQLITLPPEVILKIERDAQNEFEKMSELLIMSSSDAIIIQLQKEWTKLYKKSEAEKYFLIERQKINQQELVDAYDQKIKEKDRIINNLIKNQK